MPRKVSKLTAFSLALTLVFGVVLIGLYNHQPSAFRPVMDASVYTAHPSGLKPDQILLSPAEDSKTSLRLSWRTSEHVKEGQVQYSQYPGPGQGPVFSRQAELTVLEAPELRNDQVIHRFSVVLEGLNPGTSYSYRVGDPGTGNWSEPRVFSTAGHDKAPFSFIYFGDTQASPPQFGDFLADVEGRHPGTAFYMIAGDLVEDGERRYLWDSFASNTTKVFSQKPLAPCPGNHDYKNLTGQGLKFFSNYFNLPANGPAGRPKGLRYSFKYHNASFIVLDSNYSGSDQTDWLKERLAQNSDSDFLVVMFHHPPFSPVKGRSSPEILNDWLPLFDEYKVDLVLNGHDHSYLRTKEIKGGRPAFGATGGTVYVTATACEKFYGAEVVDQAETQFTNAVTYQQISFYWNQAGEPALAFKTFDDKHSLRDEFHLKSKRGSKGKKSSEPPAAQGHPELSLEFFS